MTEENKELEWATHALASQAAGRSRVSVPWIKELNPYTVRVILPFAETEAFLRVADKNFVFLSSYRHNLSDFIIICRPLWRVKIERMGKPCIIIHNTDKKQLMGELDKPEESNLNACRDTLKRLGGEEEYWNEDGGEVWYHGFPVRMKETAYIFKS